MTTPRREPLAADPGGTVRVDYDGQGHWHAFIRMDGHWVPIPADDAQRIVSERRARWEPMPAPEVQA